MKKKCIAICILILSVIAYPLFSTYIFCNNFGQQQVPDNNHLEALTDGIVTGSIQQVEWSKLSCQERLSLLERVIMLNYAPRIKEAVDNYYKELRGFDLIKITDVKVAAPYEYEMKIQISTYIGAHNPPYGLDVVTIRFKHINDGKIVDYEHKEDN